MQAFGEGGIFYSDQRDGRTRDRDDDSPLALRIHYREFIRTFRVEEVHVYR